MMSNPLRLLAVPLAAVLLLAGCEHADPLEPDTAAATLSSIQENVFTPSCALSGCHTGANPQMGLDLTAGQAYESLVGVASRERPDLLRVDPGDPEASYLLMKIRGADGIVGRRMPMGREALPAELIDQVHEWIANGAPAD